MSALAKRALETMTTFAASILGRDDNDESLRATAEGLTPDQLLGLLRVAAEADDAAQRAARTARRRLNLLVKVGLDRADVNKQRMVEATGITRRDLYKRPDRL